MLHHIQRHILDTLATMESARYSELKPANLDGNTFTYHLKRLMVDTYIAQTDDNNYTLTQRGKAYVVHRYEDPTTQAHSIFLIVLKVGDKWLLRKRLVQPHLHSVGFVHGEPRHDEPVVQTAQRRLLEKTGILTTLEVRGSALISISDEHELISYSHAVILYGESEQKIRIASDTTGENFTVSNKNLSSIDLLPSVCAILNAIDTMHVPLELKYTLRK